MRIIFRRVRHKVAEKLRGVYPRNKLRFVWFSAEESGLLGSEDYVATLPEAERDKIAAMLNFDMIASPNFVRFVYDGDLSDTPAPPSGAPDGSGDIEAIGVRGDLVVRSIGSGNIDHRDVGGDIDLPADH